MFIPPPSFWFAHLLRRGLSDLSSTSLRRFWGTVSLLAVNSLSLHCLLSRIHAVSRMRRLFFHPPRIPVAPLKFLRRNRVPSPSETFVPRSAPQASAPLRRFNVIRRATLFSLPIPSLHPRLSHFITLHPIPFPLIFPSIFVRSILNTEFNPNTHPRHPLHSFFSEPTLAILVPPYPCAAPHARRGTNTPKIHDGLSGSAQGDSAFGP
ncbi:hypothetical protein C8J57DRAFT_1569355 [Mycena rebaudengoi]|nr:hypothetical protein C8J57DRAFT_1569355 [Mycena rebaudengoi]